MIPENVGIPKQVAEVVENDPGLRGTFFLIVGPSGAGKSTLIAALTAREPHCIPIAPVTTRPRREDDVENKPYWFVDDADFDALLQQGRIRDVCTYCSYRYGMDVSAIANAVRFHRSAVQENVLVQWPLLRDRYPKWRMRSIFLMPPSIDVLERRIRTRSPLSDEQVRLRLESARLEILDAPRADVQVVSDEGQQEKVYETVRRYILSEIESSQP